MANQNDRNLIIAIDPDYTTGNVVAEYNPRQRYGFDLVAAVQVEWPIRLAFYRDWFAINHSRILAIVIERFYLFDDPVKMKSQAGSEMPSSRVIGVLEAEADRYDIFDRIVIQETWCKKSIRRVEDDFFANTLGGSFHNLDAYKHAAYYGLRRKNREARQRRSKGRDNG